MKVCIYVYLVGSGSISDIRKNVLFECLQDATFTLVSVCSLRLPCCLTPTGALLKLPIPY